MGRRKQSNDVEEKCSSPESNNADEWSLVTSPKGNDVEGKLTLSVIITCIIAASAGLMFGYDLGVSGGVTTMEPFLKKFFPSVLEKMSRAKHDRYCVYDSHTLTAFTSSLYLAGLVSSLVAGIVTTVAGRKGTLLIGGLVFLTGAAVSALAINVILLLLGRILLGFGVGFTNQATPVYLSEMAPPNWRGALSTAFQFCISTGVVLATFINFAAAQMGEKGWRVSLGCAAIPGAIMTVGAIFIPDTPSSLIRRGKLDEARESLAKARGPAHDSDAELRDMIRSAGPASAAGLYGEIFRRQYRPQLVLTVAIPAFQQLTGINIVAFYAPVVFTSMGSGMKSALIGAIVLGVVNLGSTLVSAYLIDKAGRRFLFLEGGIQLICSQVAIGVIFALQKGPITTQWAIIVLIFMCSISAAFGWAWGPLCWILPSEILPTEIRPVGLGICVAVNFLTTFILSQVALSMFCRLKYGVFLLYAGFTLIMTVFVALFVPETKGLPLESMNSVWTMHWYWRRYNH